MTALYYLAFLAAAATIANCHSLAFTPVDCSAVLCALPKCGPLEILVTPEGECCPKCQRDCSRIFCSEPICKQAEKLERFEGECCPGCVPDPSRCLAVSCVLPICKQTEKLVTPEGECCPVCVSSCIHERCPLSICMPGWISFTPKGECCPVCRPNPCNLIDCKLGSICKVNSRGKPFCEPSCSINNGGCPLNQTCSLKQVQCVHPPCPPIVQCTDPCEECTDQQICRLETLRCLIPPCPLFARCFERKVVCSLPPETGPCEALINRFFYNSASGKCERFIYGGCGGNDNNFETLKACESSCRVSVSPCDTIRCADGFTCEVFNGKEGFCQPNCSLNNGGCLPNQTCRLENVLCIRAPCPPIRVCEDPPTVPPCPPTCSKEFCQRNSRALCSNPGPREIPGCTGRCNLSVCRACYFNDEFIFPVPGECPTCSSPQDYISNAWCFQRWARCTAIAHRLMFGRPNKTSPEDFKCYTPPCPLRG